MNFEACLSLPRDPHEADLIADNLEALARALHEWPAEAWRKLAASAPESKTPNGLFERLAQRTARADLDASQRARALQSVEAAAAVLRVLWPEARAGKTRISDEDRLLATA